MKKFYLIVLFVNILKNFIFLVWMARFELHTRNALPPQGSVSTVPHIRIEKNRPKLYLFFLSLSIFVLYST